MKQTQRALRRHHRQRLIARALASRIIQCWKEEDRLQMALRWYNNMKKCSCWMCGHRRKWNGPTTQELRRSQNRPGDEE